MEGTYEILGVIGRSGLGTLYRARFQGKSAFTKLVTLKMLDDGVADSDEVACRLRDEARVLGFLKHRAIVQIDRLARLGGRWTLVQENVDGVDLEAIIEQGAVPAGPALEIVATVAGALHAAYTTPGPDGSPLRLQHRDIKPGAVLVDAYGAPRVVDFGIARACFSGREARTRSFVVGSFEYMAPERLALEEGGPWSDVYSLGQVFYALLMGHNFGRSHPSERHHKAIIDKAMDKLLARPGGVDEGVLELLGRMLAMEPHERPDARSVERSCLQLVRSLRDETLRGWAEQVVEPMLMARAGKSSGGLVGKLLREGEAPAAPPPPAPPDPSLVGGPQVKAKPRPVPSPRRELEPLPVHTFSASSDDDDATEIMTRPKAGGAPLLSRDDEDDGESTEMFTRPQPSVEPSSRADRGADEPVTSSGLPEDLQDEIDLSVPEDAAPVFRFVAEHEPPVEPTLPPPSPEEPLEDESLNWPVEEVSEPVEVMEDLDAARPTVVQPPEPHDDLDDLDRGRPTVVQEPADVEIQDELGPEAGARPTAVSWFADEVRGELPQQGVGEVTAVTPPEISEGLYPQFEQPAGSLDDATAVGADLETARAERSEMAQVRFDMPAGAQDDRTIETADSQVAEPRSELAQVRFDIPAGALDERTALGEDIEAARAEHDQQAHARFDMPAGALDESTAVGEDLERYRDQDAAPAMPRVQFDVPETAAAPRPPQAQPPASTLPPALAMPTPVGPPPPPGEPLPPIRVSVASEPPPPPVEPPAPPAEPPPPSADVVPLTPLEQAPTEPPPPPAEPPPPPAEPPPPPAEPPPPPPETLPSPEGPPPPDEPPAPPAEPPPPLPATVPPPNELPPPPPPPVPDDSPSISQAKPWSPDGEQSAPGDRAQLDYWEPPSFDTLSGQSPPPPAAELTPAPMPEPLPEAPPPVGVEIHDEPAVDVVVEDGPAPLPPAPGVAEPPPPPSEGTDATVARSDSAAIPAPPIDIRGPVAGGADAQPPAPKKKKSRSKLLLVLVALVLLGLLFVVVSVAAGAAWYFLM